MKPLPRHTLLSPTRGKASRRRPMGDTIDGPSRGEIPPLDRADLGGGDESWGTIDKHCVAPPFYCRGLREGLGTRLFPWAALLGLCIILDIVDIESPFPTTLIPLGSTRNQ